MVTQVWPSRSQGGGIRHSSRLIDMRLPFSGSLVRASKVTRWGLFLMRGGHHSFESARVHLTMHALSLFRSSQTRL